MATGRLTHVDEQGSARMVDVSGKASTHRRAIAEAVIHMHRETLAMILDGRAPKATSWRSLVWPASWRPRGPAISFRFCHSLSLTQASVDFEPGEDGVLVRATVETNGPTGSRWKP